MKSARLCERTHVSDALGEGPKRAHAYVDFCLCLSHRWLRGKENFENNILFYVTNDVTLFKF